MVAVRSVCVFVLILQVAWPQPHATPGREPGASVQRPGCQFGGLARVEVASEVRNDWSDWRGCGTPDLLALAWGVAGEGGAGSGRQAPACQPRAPAREAGLGSGFSRVCECVRRNRGRRGKLHWNLSLFSPEILELSSLETCDSRRARDEGGSDPSASHSKAVTLGPTGCPVCRLWWISEDICQLM